MRLAGVTLKWINNIIEADTTSPWEGEYSNDEDFFVNHFC